MQLEIYFSFNTILDTRKTLFAVGYLRGKAQQWMKPYIRRHMDHNEDLDQMFWYFCSFKEAIRRVFGISNKEPAAERAVQYLTQKTSAAEYAARFQEQANLTEWDDAALITMFCQGLKENVKDKLMQTGAQVDDLQTLIARAIDLDDKLYERNMEKHYGGNFQGQAGSYTGYHQRQQRGPVNTLQYGDPMEIDTTQRRKGKISRGQQNNKKEKKCYSCGKTGHFAKNCRSKNVVQRQQFNATLRVPEDKEKSPKEDDNDNKMSTTSDHVSEDDDKGFCIVNNREQLQDVLAGRISVKQAASTSEVNAAIREALRPSDSPEPKEDKAAERELLDKLYDDLDRQRDNLDKMMDRFGKALDVIDKGMDQVITKAFKDAEKGRLFQLRPAGETADDPQAWLTALNNAKKKLEDTQVPSEPSDCVEHVRLHWTACYDDDCQTHMSSKEGANWFPRKPRRRQQSLMRVPLLLRNVTSHPSGNGTISW